MKNISLQEQMTRRDKLVKEQIIEMLISEGWTKDDLKEYLTEEDSELLSHCQDKNGYFIAEKPEDLNHTIAQINSRIHKMIKAREGLKKAQKLMEENKL